MRKTQKNITVPLAPNTLEFPKFHEPALPDFAKVFWQDEMDRQDELIGTVLKRVLTSLVFL